MEAAKATFRRPRTQQHADPASYAALGIGVYVWRTALDHLRPGPPSLPHSSSRR
jgi:hypothetical protein